MIEDLKHIQTYSTNELEEIVFRSRSAYSEEFLQTAESELNRRNEAATSVRDEEQQAPGESGPEADIADLSLNNGQIIATFFMPTIIAVFSYVVCIYLIETPGALILALPAAIVAQVAWIVKLKSEGYEKMSVEMKMWALNCWIFYVAVFVLKKMVSLLFIAFPKY